MVLRASAPNQGRVPALAGVTTATLVLPAWMIRVVPAAPAPAASQHAELLARVEPGTGAGRRRARRSYGYRVRTSETLIDTAATRLMLNRRAPP